MRDSERLISAWAQGIRLKSLTTYGAQVRKALAILDAEEPLRSDPQDVQAMVGGKDSPKTRAFYWNILCPLRCLDVTIDRWILRALLDLDAIDGGNHYRSVYRQLAKEFIDFALAHNWVPCELQAAVWFCAKETMDGREFRNVKTAEEFAEKDLTPAPF